MSAAGPLNNRQKAALVVLGLEESIACEMLRNLEEEEVRSLVKCVEEMSTFQPEALDGVFAEFEQKMKAPMLPRSGGAYVRKLAATALGEQRAQQVLNPIGGSLEPLAVIRTARTATLAELLQQEHPQIAAAILSQLTRQQASQVLLAMPQDRQSDLVRRVASLQEIPTRELNLASHALVKALTLAGGIADTAQQSKFSGVNFAADLLNDVPPDESERLLAAIDEADSQLGPKIREAMFIFDDLKRITGRALQTLMREVPSESMLLALKTAGEDMREHFFSAISSRAAEQMREDLSLLPPTRLSDVERAQREIVECAMRLAAEGQITLPTSGGEKLV